MDQKVQAVQQATDSRFPPLEAPAGSMGAELAQGTSQQATMGQAMMRMESMLADLHAAKSRKTAPAASPGGRGATTIDEYRGIRRERPTPTGSNTRPNLVGLLRRVRGAPQPDPMGQYCA